MDYGIPEDLDLSSLDGGSDNTPAPGVENPGLLENQGATNQGSFDPNLPITYKASGKDLTEPLSAVIQRAQRGYDYAQLVAQHKQQVDQQQAEYQARQQQIQEMESQWKPYHEYASQNPEWANYVRQQWENRFNSQQQAAPEQRDQQQANNPNLPPEVQRELSEMRQFMSEMKQQQANARQAEQDAALAQEIQNIQKQYSDVDFSHTDPETGETLERRVLRHAQENRIFNFGAAFKDFYFDKLMERNVTRAKEEVAKTMQQKTKSGFLAQSPTPLMQNGQAPNVRGMSYHQLMDLAATELGI
jgi:hypothetical protein